MKNFRSIKKSSDFRTVYRKGTARKRGCLVMYVGANGTDETRLGVSAGRKIGNSVTRHRFTRRIREIFRANIEKTDKGRDIIIVALGAAGKEDFAHLTEYYQKLLEDHKILLSDAGSTKNC